MTYKERMKKSISHIQTDIVPCQIDFTTPAYEKMQKYYKDSQFVRKLGNHIAGISTGMDYKEIKPGFCRDEWGVMWDRTIDKDIGNACNVVIENKDSLDSYKFPDPHNPQRFKQWDEIIEENKDLFIRANIDLSFFERAWTLRGMENLLVDMISDEEFVDALLERILEYNISIIEEISRFSVDGVHFGDDWGQQQGLIMGPKLWRRFIKPRLEKMYAKVHEAGLSVFIHSCGDVDELFPELIEIGVDVFNPFQPEVMDIYEMKKKYGGKLCFFGGLSIQKILPYGTPDDVRKEVKRLIKELGSGGGYIFAPAHAVPGDVSEENIAAMIEAVKDQ